MSDKSLVIKVIESVRKRRHLWDPTVVEYGKREHLERCWNEVAMECQSPVRLCRDKWKNVRTGFLRSLKEYPENSGVGLPRKKPFYLHEYMQFLLPFRPGVRGESSSSLGNISDGDLSSSRPENNVVEVIRVEDSSDSETLDIAELDRYDLQPEEPYYSHLNVSNLNKVGTSVSESDEPTRKRFRSTSISDEHETETKEELALMSFFRGIVPDVLSLSVRNQRFFKRKIVEFVDDLNKEEEKLKTKEPPTVNFSNKFNT